MKKILLTIVCASCFLLSGCGSYSEDDVVKELSNKALKSNSYYIEGEMEIVNNEDIYTYDVKVAYAKDNNYRVELTNISNNHKQIILRNDEGVYVITPSLNKSFKFQSDWPYNNSQIYLLSSLADDLSDKTGRTFKKHDNDYVFTTKVNYPNNSNLVKQMIHVDKKLKVTQVRVVDKEGKDQIKMTYNKITYNKKFDDKYFELSSIIDTTTKDTTENNTNTNTNTNSTTNANSNTNTNTNANTNTDSEENTTSDDDISSSKNTNTNTNTNSNTNTNDNTNTKTEHKNTEQTATIDDIIYPMYLPTNTYLSDQEKVNTTGGQRLILTFKGDSPFTLVEETVSYSTTHEIIPTYGELELLLDSVAIVNDNSVNWINNGIEYYMVSDAMTTAEILEVARSISVLPVSK